MRIQGIGKMIFGDERAMGRMAVSSLCGLALMLAVPSLMLAQTGSTTSTPPTPTSTSGSNTNTANTSTATPGPTTPNSTTNSTTPASTNPTISTDKKPISGDAKADDSKTDDATSDVKPEDIPSPGDRLDTHIKTGSEDDVNAAGTRNIGGRGVGNWFSTNWEISTGKQYSLEVEKTVKLVNDPVVTEYVNRIGQNIVKNSDCKVPFTIKVIDTDEINAFALPGGYFYVNSGLILAADEEAELAGVMAHETAHVCAHHAAREMTRMYYAQIGMVPLMIMTYGTWTGYGIYEAAQLAIPITFLQFSRDFETQADWLGLQYMYRAGYDPQAFITIFEKLEALEKHKPGALAKAFSTHPQTAERIKRSENEIATIMPARPDYVVTTSEFDDVKARLARLENKRPTTDGKGNSTPTLRRTSTSDPNNDGNGQSGDDRPTLNRRDN